MFPYLGLCELDSTYVIELGCAVGRTQRKGPSYSADAAILKYDRSEEGSEEGSEEETEEETEEEHDKDVYKVDRQSKLEQLLHKTAST